MKKKVGKSKKLIEEEAFNFYGLKLSFVCEHLLKNIDFYDSCEEIPVKSKNKKSINVIEKTKVKKRKKLNETHNEIFIENVKKYKENIKETLHSNRSPTLEKAGIITSEVKCKSDISASCNESTFSNIDSDLSNDDKASNVTKCKREYLKKDNVDSKVVVNTSKELIKFSFDDGYSTIDKKLEKKYEINSDIETKKTKVKKDNTRIVMYFTHELNSGQLKMQRPSNIKESDEKLSINFDQNNFSLELNNDVKTITNNYLTKTPIEGGKVIKFNNNNSNIQKLIRHRETKRKTKLNNVNQITKNSITKRKIYKLHLSLCTTKLVEEDYFKKNSLIFANSKTFYKSSLNLEESTKIIDHNPHLGIKSSSEGIHSNGFIDVYSKKSTKNEHLLDSYTPNRNENELNPRIRNEKLDENNNFSNNLEITKPTSHMKHTKMNEKLSDKEIQLSNQPAECGEPPKNDWVILKKTIGKDCTEENCLKTNDKASPSILQDYSPHDTFNSLNNNNISLHDTNNKPILKYKTYCTNFKLKFKKNNKKRKIRNLSFSEIFSSDTNKIEVKDKTATKDYHSFEVGSNTELNWENEDVFAALLDDNEEDFIESNVDDEEKIDPLINFNNNNDEDNSEREDQKDNELIDLTDDSSDTITNDENISTNNSKILGDIQTHKNKDFTNVSRPPSASSLKNFYAKFQRKPSNQFDAGDKNSLQNLTLDESDKFVDQQSIKEINFTRSPDEGTLATIFEDDRSETESNLDAFLEKSFVRTNSLVNKPMNSSQREERNAALSEKTQEIKRCLEAEENRINNINQTVKRFFSSKQMTQQKLLDMQNEISNQPVFNPIETMPDSLVKNSSISQENKSRNETSYKSKKNVIDQNKQGSSDKDNEFKQTYPSKTEPPSKMLPKTSPIVTNNSQHVEQTKPKFVSDANKQKFRRSSPLKYKNLVMDRIDNKNEKTMTNRRAFSHSTSINVNNFTNGEKPDKTESFTSTQSDQMEKIDTPHDKKKLTNEQIKITSLYFPKPETNEISTITSRMRAGLNCQTKNHASFKIEELPQSDIRMRLKEQESSQSIPHYVAKAKLNDLSMNEANAQSIISHEDSYFSAQTQQKLKTELSMESSPNTFGMKEKMLNESPYENLTAYEIKEKFLKETTLDPTSNKIVTLNELGSTNKDALTKIFQMAKKDLLNEKNIVEVLDKTKFRNLNEDQASKSMNTSDNYITDLNENKELFKKKLIKETKKKCLSMEKHLIDQTKDRMKFLQEGLEGTLSTPSPTSTNTMPESNLSPKIETAITSRNRDAVYKEKHTTLIEDIKRRQKLKRIQEALQKRKESELRSVRLFRTNVLFVSIGILAVFLGCIWSFNFLFSPPPAKKSFWDFTFSF